MPVFEFDRCFAAENIHSDLQFSTFRIDFLNHTAEVKERSVVNLDSLSKLEADAGLFGEESGQKVIHDCTLGPGEILWLGHEWWHATLNIGDTVFLSTFI